MRTIELAESLGRTDSVLTGLVGLWAAMFVQGQMADCEAAGRRALALAQPGSSFSGAAHFALGGAMMCMGRPVESLPHLTLAVEQARHVSLIMGPRPDLHAAAFESHAHWLLGEPDTARDRCRDGLARARAVTEAPYNLAMALAYAAVTWQLCGDVEEMLSTVAELDELCRRYGFGYYREWALVLRGWHLGGRDGLELARRGLANLRAQGALARMPYWLALVADVRARAGESDASRSTLDAAIVSARSRREVWWLPEVLRVRAQYDGDPDAVAARLLEAARMATEHGSVALPRRCAADLERLGVRLPA